MYINEFQQYGLTPTILAAQNDSIHVDTAAKITEKTSIKMKRYAQFKEDD